MSISYDQITGRIIDLRQTRDQTNWEAGDLCWYAMERMGANASMLAADTGYSAQHIRDLAKTSQVFHTPDDRRPGNTLSGHTTKSRPGRTVQGIG